jgi:cell division protein ZapA
MAQITINIHKREYQVACEDGQEAHVQKLANYIDRRVGEMAAKTGVPGPAGQIAESRLLVMAALLVADELGEAYDQLEEMRQAPPKMVPDPATVKAAEEARAAASAAKVQLGEAEAATRAATIRMGEAEAARRAAEAEAQQVKTALSAVEARFNAMEEAVQAAEARVAQADSARQYADGEASKARSVLSGLEARIRGLDEAGQAAQVRASQAEARAMDLEEAVKIAQQRATQAEASLQIASSRIGDLEKNLAGAEGETLALQHQLAASAARTESAVGAEDQLTVGLEGLAGRIEAMAERLERATAR